MKISELNEGLMPAIRRLMSGDPQFKAWYKLYQQDPKIAQSKFPSKHEEFKQKYIG